MSYVSLIDGHIDEPKVMEANFHINVRPFSIDFVCPNCGSHVEIMWDKLDVPDYWGEDWGAVKCPECDKYIKLGDYEYD